MASDEDEKTQRRKQHGIYVTVDQVKDTIHTDQTGKLPINSSRGHKYIMIVCEIDGNKVLAEPMKNKMEDSMVETYQKMIEMLKLEEFFRRNNLDNEISENYKT